MFPQRLLICTGESKVLFIILADGPQLYLASNRLMAEEKQNLTIACTATGKPQPNARSRGPERRMNYLQKELL